MRYKDFCTRMQALLPTVSNACLVQASPPFQIVQVSPDFASSLGFGSDEVQGSGLSLLHGPNSSSVYFEDVITRLKSGKEQGIWLDMQRKDGECLHACAKVSILRISDECGPEQTLVTE